MSYLEYFDVSQPERVAALLERAMKTRRWAGWWQHVSQHLGKQAHRGIRVVSAVPAGPATSHSPSNRVGAVGEQCLLAVALKSQLLPPATAWAPPP